jgi:DNA-binding response OmpR family regulator
VGIATVFLVGIDDLERVPDFLELGAVVVIAPDRHTLRRWQEDTERPTRISIDEAPREEALVIDLARRQVLCWGRPVDLTDLEFRVLAALTDLPRSARSFRDLRRAGWGDGPDLPCDIYPVRSLVQRLRVKLRAAEAPICIEAVRGFGYRIGDGEPPPLELTRSDRTA